MAAAKELEIVTSQSVPGTPGAHDEHLPTEEAADAQAAAIAVPEDTGEGGKLKMIVQLVKKCLGVKDIAAMYVLIRLLVSFSSRCSYTM